MERLASGISDLAFANRSAMVNQSQHSHPELPGRCPADVVGPPG